MTDLCPVSGGLRWLLNPFPAASQTSTCKWWERPVSQNRHPGRGSPGADKMGNLCTLVWDSVGQDGRLPACPGCREEGEAAPSPTCAAPQVKMPFDYIALDCPVEFSLLCCPLFE